MASPYLSLESINRMTAETVEHTGAMVALIPNEDDARRLLVAGYEPLDELHVTLAFLGKGDDWTDLEQKQIIGAMATVAGRVGKLEGRLWASAHFNPYGPEPAAVYLVGGGDMDRVHVAAWRLLPHRIAEINHAPWVPHITIGYGLDPARLTQATGAPITFDRLRVAFSGEHHDLPLS